MSTRQKRELILVLAIAGLFAARTAFADGMIVPIEPLPRPAPLGDLYSVKYHRVSVDISDQVATTTVEQAFINETRGTIEVQYVFPMPRGAQINKFSLIVGDREIPGKIVGKDEARKIYEDIVRRQKDPALLEYIGEGMFRTSVFPLPAGEERKVKIVYSELLERDGNRVEYRYPLNTEKFSKKVLEEVRVDFRLDSATALKTVYSPSHDVSLDWDGNTRVKGHWSKEGIRPVHDFRLFWTLSKDEVGATMFTYRPDASEDGFFLFLASPEVEKRGKKGIAKNVIVVLDVSGSMSGEKIEQARNAAKFIAENLNTRDRFNIIFYDDAVNPVWDELRDYTAETRSEAVARIRKAEAGGSTDINAALEKALDQMPDDNRPNFIIFLTDGQPTAGVTDLDKIVENVAKSNDTNAKMFVFGVGYDVNAVLLDRLGTDNHGLAEYVRPGEDIEGKVSGFYSKIQNPALTDIDLAFSGGRVRDSYPRTLPDMFRGGQLVVVGRYRDSGAKTVTLTGKVGDKKRTFTYDVNFARKTDREGRAFVARLWAQKKIGYLIEQIRLHGEKKEYVEEIVDLSARYGIMTAYTSFLADEDVAIDDVAANRARAAGELKKKGSITTGASGINQSIASGNMQKAAQAPNQAGYLNEEGEMVQLDTVRIIGSKTFYLKKGVWVDAEYREGMKITELRQFSDPYFRVANDNVTQAQYMTFTPTETIIVVIEGKAYKITVAK